MAATRNDKPPFTLACFHIFVFSCFAIAQPLFDLLGNYPEFFIAHAFDEFDLLLLTISLTYLLPLPLVGVLALLNAISFAWLRAVLVTIVLMLTLLLYLPLIKLTGFPDLLTLLSSIALAGTTTLLYFKSRTVQGFSSLLGLLLIVSPIYFLLYSPVSALLNEPEPGFEVKFSSPSKIPVVVVIFDEFPLSAIMNEQYGIDHLNFPNFARLADISYWFRNGTTVAASTVLAVPAIMSGNYPSRFSKPTLAAYPDNIFTLLANSHLMNVKEGPTRLCPKTVCDDTEWVLPRASRFLNLLADVAVVYGHFVLPQDFSGKLPPMGDTWNGFGLATEENSTTQLSDARLFNQFVEHIRPGNPEGLHLIHLELPHIPYEYLPSGKSYSGGSVMPGKTGEFWGKDRLMVNQAYQRLLLQLGMADRMIGMLLNKLQALDMLESTVLVVTADHGAAFLPDRNRRGDLRNKILQSSIMPVPLFIKIPGQLEGRIDDRNAEVIDILPTIVELVGLEGPPQFDGQNLIGENWRERENKKFLRGLRKMWEFKAEPHLDHKNRIISWKYRNFYDRQGLKLSLYDKGPNAEFLKKPITDLSGIVASDHGYTLDESISLEVDHSSSFVPAHLFGQLDIQSDLAPVDLVFAINNVVQATSHSYVVDGVHRFSSMVPESAFNHGPNMVEVFSVKKLDGTIQLNQLVNRAVSLDHYRLMEASPGKWILDDVDESNMSIDDDRFFGARVKTSIEGWDTLRFVTEIDVKMDQPDRYEILIFEGEKCIYKHTLVTQSKGKYPATFTLPTSKFRDFGELPIRLYAIDSSARSRELGYNSRYPYL